MTIERPRVLSVALASRKIAYVLLIDGKLKDWKRSRAGGMSAPKGRSFLSMAIKRHQPDLVLLGMPILFRVCLVGRSDPSTVRMISSYSEAGYLICRRPHPRSCFFLSSGSQASVRQQSPSGRPIPIAIPSPRMPNRREYSAPTVF
jgi:hypothetical protein